MQLSLIGKSFLGVLAPSTRDRVIEEPLQLELFASQDDYSAQSHCTELDPWQPISEGQNPINQNDPNDQVQPRAQADNLQRGKPQQYLLGNGLVAVQSNPTNPNSPLLMLAPDDGLPAEPVAAVVSRYANPLEVEDPPALRDINGDPFQPTVDFRRRPDNALPGSITPPKAISRKEACIESLLAAEEGKRVTGSLQRWDDGNIRTSNFLVNSLDGEFLILQSDIDLSKYFPTQSPVTRVSPDGQGLELYRIHRQDFAQYLDSVQVRNAFAPEPA